MSGAKDDTRWTLWVRKTVDKMKCSPDHEKHLWDKFWLEAYREIGGRAKTTGSKGCPRAAAYGLWFLGRISEGGRPKQNWPIERIRESLGKNAAYALLALKVLEKDSKIDGAALWLAVKESFIERFPGEKPAKSEQGEVALTADLYKSGQII